VPQTNFHHGKFLSKASAVNHTKNGKDSQEKNRQEMQTYKHPKKGKKKGDFAEMAYQIQEQKACEEAAAKKLERWVFLCFSVPGKRELLRREAAT
jgi:hypothetical protein